MFARRDRTPQSHRRRTPRNDRGRHRLDRPRVDLDAPALADPPAPYEVAADPFASAYTNDLPAPVVTYGTVVEHTPHLEPEPESDTPPQPDPSLEPGPNLDTDSSLDQGSYLDQDSYLDLDSYLDQEPYVDPFLELEPTPRPTPERGRASRGSNLGRRFRGGVLILIALIIALLAAGYLAAIFLLGTNPPATPILGHSMNPTLFEGDLVLLKSTNPANLKVGDVIGFRITPGNQAKYGLPANFVHRISGIQGSGGSIQLSTKGDNNPTPDAFTTMGDNVTGVMVFHLPRAGYVLMFMGTPQARVLAVAIVFLVVVYALLGMLDTRRKEAASREELLVGLVADLPLLRARIDHLNAALWLQEPAQKALGDYSPEPPLELTARDQSST